MTELAPDERPTDKTAPALEPGPTSSGRLGWVAVWAGGIFALLVLNSLTAGRPMLLVAAVGLAVSLAFGTLGAIAGRLLGGEFRLRQHSATGLIGVLGCGIAVVLVFQLESLWGLHVMSAGLSIWLFGVVSLLVYRVVFHVRRGRGGWGVALLGVACGAGLSGALYFELVAGQKTGVSPGYHPAAVWLWDAEPLDEFLTRTVSAEPRPVATPTTAAQRPRREGLSTTRVPAGAFTRGCGDPSCMDRPLVRVELPAFDIETLEVTSAAYEACVAGGGCTPRWRDADCAAAADPQLPVDCVSLTQARAYCRWLGGRLPSADEWEKAARGDRDARRYPWGDRAPSCAWAALGGCPNWFGRGGTHPRDKSPYGVLDMLGNASEWVEPPAEDGATLRGDSTSEHAHLASYYDVPPWILEPTIGFRCAFDP